jgi:cyclohexanone monooxygenase
VTVAFIGGGFAGLVTGARLKEAGVSDVRIIEKGGGFGGTWYWNRYPGAMCDTASMVDMPLPSWGDSFLRVHRQMAVVR